MNTLDSAYVLLPRNLKSADGTPILIVTGWAFASDPGSFHAISLDPNGLPYEVFASDTFELTDLADLDGDGLIEIIGRHTFSEDWGPCFETYDPFSVYRLSSSKSGKASLSPVLSEEYNKTHYFGWAGPKHDENWTVVRCAPGKPQILATRDAERLFK